MRLLESFEIQQKQNKNNIKTRILYRVLVYSLIDRFYYMNKNP